MEPEADLYKRTPPDIYIRIAGIYYKRVTGKGWSVIPEPAHIVDWDRLHQVQYDAYYPVLVNEGLIK